MFPFVGLQDVQNTWNQVAPSIQSAFQPQSSSGGGMFSLPGEALASSLVSGAFNYFGAREANKASAAQAQKQMDFQERMSNTSYQRAVADMKAAGINPLLAAGAGGASSPGGASAVMQNELGGAVSSALQARRLSYEIQNMKAQNKLLEAQVDETEASAEMKRTLSLLSYIRGAGTSARAIKDLGPLVKKASSTLSYWKLFKELKK